eukprot:XP_017951130.1 PREDICTED: mitogen-activated protein kinase 14-like [Xenopus tropicalis]
MELSWFLLNAPSASSNINGQSSSATNNRLHETVSMRMSKRTRIKLKRLHHQNILGVEKISMYYYTTSLISLPLGMYISTLDKVIADTSISRFLSYFQQIASALQYLHSENILHCDLRCKYIYVNPQAGTLKVGHFGRAVTWESNQTRFVIKKMPLDAEKWYVFKATENWCERWG